MQNQPDPASIWWNTPTAPAHHAPIAFRPRPRPASTLLVTFLLFTCAPLCWLVASEQLRGMDAGTVDDTHRGWIAFARGWSKFWTVLGLVFLAFALVAAITAGPAYA